MKRISKLNFVMGLLLAGSVMTSCSKDEGPLLVNEYISFSEATATVKENETDTLSLQVKIVGAHQTSDVTVDFTTSGSAVAGTDFNLVTTSPVTIPAGESFATIQYLVVDNFEEDGTKNLVFELTGSSSSLDLGQNGMNYGKIDSVFITDNDCTLDVSGFAGTWFMDEGNPDWNWNTGITVDALLPIITMDNFGGAGGVIAVNLETCEPYTLYAAEGQNAGGAGTLTYLEGTFDLTPSMDYEYSTDSWGGPYPVAASKQ